MSALAVVIALSGAIPSSCAVNKITAQCQGTRTAAAHRSGHRCRHNHAHCRRKCPPSTLCCGRTHEPKAPSVPGKTQETSRVTLDIGFLCANAAIPAPVAVSVLESTSSRPSGFPTLQHLGILMQI